MKKHAGTIMFWGAVWGIEEATLGHYLHMLPFNIGWMFWFPLAYFFTNAVFKSTGRLNSILFTSSIAASIKLIDLLIPVRIDRVINPAASILLEGLAVYAVLLLSEKSENLLKHKGLAAAASSISWRVLYLAYVLMLPKWIVSLSPWSGAMPFSKFLLLESTVNTLLIFLTIKAAGKIKKTELKKIQSDAIKGYASFALLAAAVFIQWVF